MHALTRMQVGDMRGRQPPTLLSEFLMRQLALDKVGDVGGWGEPWYVP